MLNLLLSASFAALTLAAPNMIPRGIVHPMRHAINEAFWTPKISYTYGNPVLTKDVNLYYIYYGDFSDSQKETLEQ
jgi:hypothetical protein